MSGNPTSPKVLELGLNFVVSADSNSSYLAQVLRTCSKTETKVCPELYPLPYTVRCGSTEPPLALYACKSVFMRSLATLALAMPCEIGNSVEILTLLVVELCKFVLA